MNAFYAALFAVLLLSHARPLVAESPPVEDPSGPEALWVTLAAAREVRLTGSLPFNRDVGEPRPVLWLGLPATLREPAAIGRLREFLRAAALEFDAETTAELASGGRPATAIAVEFTLDAHVSFGVLASDLVIFADHRAYRPAAYHGRRDTNFSRELALLLASLGIGASPDRPRPDAP